MSTSLAVVRLRALLPLAARRSGALSFECVKIAVDDGKGQGQWRECRQDGHWREQWRHPRHRYGAPAQAASCWAPLLSIGGRCFLCLKAQSMQSKREGRLKFDLSQPS